MTLFLKSALGAAAPENIDIFQRQFLWCSRSCLLRGLLFKSLSGSLRIVQVSLGLFFLPFLSPLLEIIALRSLHSLRLLLCLCHDLPELALLVRLEANATFVFL